MFRLTLPALSARAGGAALTRLRRRLGAPASRRGDEGFMLLESVVAIALTTLLLAGLASFFASAVASTGSQRVRQAAVQLASSQMEAIRALPASDLVEGRDSASVTSQVAAAPPAVRQSLGDPATDASAAAGSGATATVPTAPTTQVVGPTTYTMSTYLGRCRVGATVTSPCDVTGASVGYLRAVVAVTWPGAQCPAATCSYVTSTVLSPDDDPVFALNEAPPPAPLAHAPGAQVWTIGAPAQLQLSVEQGTGVPTMTWGLKTGGLPTGVAVESTGLVTGTPTATGGPTSATVEVTDAFLRQDTTSFTWRVVNRPTVTAPASQSTVAGSPVNLAAPASTCPNNPCRFSMTGAPAGLVIAASTGAITGTPTTPGTTSDVTLTIIDAAGATASAGFRWDVTYAPLVITDPTAQKSTKGTALPFPGLLLAATGGSGSYTWSAVSGLPVGLTVSSSGAVTGTPTTTGTTQVTVRASDPTAGKTTDRTFTWTVVDPPTVAVPTTLVTTTVGLTKSVAVPYTCPYATCTLTLAGGVPGVGLSSTASTTGNNTTTSLPVTATSGTVYLAGTVQPAAVASGTSASLAPVVTVTDGAGAKVSSTGSWRVYAAATIASPGTLSATEGNVMSVPLAYTCPYASCTIGLAGGVVPGVGLSTSSSTTGNNTTTSLTVSAASGTVHLAGTVQSTAVTTGASAPFSPRLTITDFGGAAASVAGSWTISAPSALGTLGTRAVTVGGAEDVGVAYTCNTPTCTVSVASPVPGVGLSKTSGGGTTNSTTSVSVAAGSGSVYLNGIVAPSAVPSGTSRAWATAVMITDSNDTNASTSATWTAYTAPTVSNPGSQAVQPNQALSLQTAASCPNGGCTYTAEYRTVGTTPWTAATISSTGKLSATSVAAGAYEYRVTVRDGDAMTASTTFTLTAQTFALTIPNQSTVKPTDSSTKTVTFDVAPRVTPVANGYTYSLSGQPSWLSINPSTGVLTAAVVKGSSSDSSITVTATSTASPTSTVSATFGWSLS